MTTTDQVPFRIQSGPLKRWNEERLLTRLEMEISLELLFQEARIARATDVDLSEPEAKREAGELLQDQYRIGADVDLAPRLSSLEILRIDRVEPIRPAGENKRGQPTVVCRVSAVATLAMFGSDRPTRGTPWPVALVPGVDVILELELLSTTYSRFVDDLEERGLTEHAREGGVC